MIQMRRDSRDDMTSMMRHPSRIGSSSSSGQEDGRSRGEGRPVQRHMQRTRGFQG